MLKIGDKVATVDLTRQRVFTAGTVVEFGYDDETERERVKGEHTLSIKTFFKQGDANVDWQPTDLDPDHAAISLYHLIDQTEPLTGKPRKMRYQVSLHAVVLASRSAVPRTSSGKVQRYLCRSAWLDGTLEQHGT